MMDLSQVTFRDRIVPAQPFLREQFEGDEQDFYTTLYEVLTRFSGLKPPGEEFQLHTSDQVPTQLMASTPLVLRLLQVLILLKRPQRILEVGTFIGLSALYMADVLPEDGRIVTVEKYAHFAELARQNFLANGVGHKIQLIQGDAFEALQRFNHTPMFDMVFLDGNKERYGDYFPLLDALLLPRGLFVADDVLFRGDALNEHPKDAKGIGVKQFLEVVEQRTDYHKVILPIDSGLMLLVKRAP